MAEKSPRIAITGLVRNCAGSLQKMFDLTRRIGAEFPDWTYLFLESDSEDNSLGLLREFGELNANGLVISYGKLAELSTVRTKRLAYLRNENIRILKSHSLFADVEFLIIMDMDGINDLLDVGLIRRLIVDDCGDWAGLFANQLDFYYDIWALRRKGVCQFDCLEKVRRRPFYMTKAAAIKKYIRQPQQNIPLGSQRIEVESAFGGFGIYRFSYLSEDTYVGFDVQNNHIVCEHVSFHKAVLNKGGRLYIEPELVNCRAPIEHER